MTVKQKRLLQRRLSEAIKQQPELEILERLLLRLGGTFLVAPPATDSDVTRLIESGFVTSGPVLLKLMANSACHRNLSALWKARRHGIVGIGTGYALSGDGLWRQHSWGIRREGILETTTERMKYFGIVIQGVEADHFAGCNLQGSIWPKRKKARV